MLKKVSWIVILVILVQSNLLFASEPTIMVPQEVYTPTGDPNLLLWFMADSGVTTDMDGIDVLGWDDLSGNGFDATATAAQTPTLSGIQAPNGRMFHVINFNGINTDYLTINDESGPDPTIMQTKNLAVYGVVYWNGASDTFQDIFYGNQLGKDPGSCNQLEGYYIGWQQVNSPDGKRPFHGYGRKDPITGLCNPFTHAQALANAPGMETFELSVVNGYLEADGRRGLLLNGYIQEAKKNPTRALSYVHPTLTVSSIGGSPQVGSGFGLNGGVVELIVYNNTSDRHRRKVENYLLSKYITPTCGNYGAAYLPVDINQDCNIDIADLNVLSENWLQLQ